MTNDSSTGGYLTPTGVAPLEDEALDDLLHDVVAGITGLANELVRPRWQPEPPPTPDWGADWCAMGIMHRTADTFAVEGHDSAGEGSDYLIRHEVLSLLCSFYGPNSQAKGALLRDGLSIAQNREALAGSGIALVSVGDLTKAPELVKNRWLNRADLPVVLRREIMRTYPVLNVTSAQIELNSETVTTDVVVSN